MKKDNGGIHGTIGTGEICGRQISSERVIGCSIRMHSQKESLKRKRSFPKSCEPSGTSVLRNGKIGPPETWRTYFYNREKREILNGIVHPRVIACLKREIEKAEGLLFIEIPLLFRKRNWNISAIKYW